MALLRLIAEMISSTVFSQISVKAGICPLCGKTVFLKINDTRWGVRCLKCFASVNSISLALKLMDEEPFWSDRSVYIMSASGPLYKGIKKRTAKLTSSVYNSKIENGEYYKGVISQDVQDLTFKDNSFDIIISAEVFEHVPDDRRGFCELLRVLKPGGVFLFTVPLSLENKTVERAAMVAGGIVHYLTPEYHNDSVRNRKVLSYRDYGFDITKKLESVGFTEVKIWPERYTQCWNIVSPVVSGRKAVRKI